MSITADLNDAIFNALSQEPVDAEAKLDIELTYADWDELKVQANGLGSLHSDGTTVTYLQHPLRLGTDQSAVIRGVARDGRVDQIRAPVIRQPKR